MYFFWPTVQFEGAEWDRSSSPTERLRPPGPKSSPLAGGGMKFRMPQEGHMVGERVDPALPLEKQVYVCKLMELYQLCPSHLNLSLEDRRKPK